LRQIFIWIFSFVVQISFVITEFSILLKFKSSKSVFYIFAVKPFNPNANTSRLSICQQVFHFSFFLPFISFGFYLRKCKGQFYLNANKFPFFNI
jgi:hypothetical protein